MQLNKKNLLSQREKIRLEKELHNLLHVERPRIIESLKEARSQGDLSENAEYDAARNEQASIESKISELEVILENAEIITKKDQQNMDEVHLGSEVHLEEIALEGQRPLGKETYVIVGAIEANPFKNYISNESPLGKAVLGKKVGEIVPIVGIEQSYKVKIVKISSPDN